MMSEGASVTHWIEQLKAGQCDTAQVQLWDRYFSRLVGLARKKLGDAPRRAEDEEDAALSALDSFFRGVDEGHFPKLSDRTNLWPLLARITIRKAINQRTRLLRKKRFAGQRGDSVFDKHGASSRAQGFDELPGDEPTPEFVARLNEETVLLLDRLCDTTLREVAVSKMYGCTNAEIATKLGVVERTVERKLERIREIWAVEGE
jgi:DNA-directed RNA polymerase specialized sigma24 family protein